MAPKSASTSLGAGFDSERPDRKLIRFLYRRYPESPAVWRSWDASPLFVLPSDGFSDYLAEARAALGEVAAPLEHLVAEDFVIMLDHPPRETGHENALMCLRIETAGTALADVAHRPWFDFYLHPDDGEVDVVTAAVLADPDRWLVVTDASHQATVDGEPGDSYQPPEVYYVDRRNPLRSHAATSWGDEPSYEEYAANIDEYNRILSHKVVATLEGWEEKKAEIRAENAWQRLCLDTAMMAVQYLAAPPVYFVEADPKPPTPKRPLKKKEEPRPWQLRKKHIVLIDPLRVAEFKGEALGSQVDRRSPMPHQRRGHWRRLDPQGDRRTWVKPAWVGPSAWTLGGREYRVLR